MEGSPVEGVRQFVDGMSTRRRQIRASEAPDGPPRRQEGAFVASQSTETSSASLERLFCSDLSPCGRHGGLSMRICRLAGDTSAGAAEPYRSVSAGRPNRYRGGRKVIQPDQFPAASRTRR